MCPPAHNSGVPVRVWAVRPDVPVSLVPSIVGLIPTRRKMGTVWSVYIPFRFCLDFIGVCILLCLGLPCKVFNQSIVASHRYPRLLNQLAMISLNDGTS
jgi:hypothetical protein